jgi:hypothetical protein
VGNHVGGLSQPKKLDWSNTFKFLLPDVLQLDFVVSASSLRSHYCIHNKMEGEFGLEIASANKFTIGWRKESSEWKQ